MTESKPTSIKFFSEGFKELEFLAKFSYPSTISAAASELNVKAWHVLRAFQLLNEELSNKPYIEQILSKHIAVLSNALNSHQEKGPFVVWLENYRISFAIEALFFQIKAFLDFFAIKVIEKALNMNSGLQTFKSKGSGSTRDPGRSFLDALQNNAPKESKIKAAAIVGIIGKHKPLWIDVVIRDRDKATHYGTLQTKITMNSGLLTVPITNFSFQIFFEENNLTEFNNSLAGNFLKFLEEILQEIRTIKQSY